MFQRVEAANVWKNPRNKYAERANKNHPPLHSVIFPGAYVWQYGRGGVYAEFRVHGRKRERLGVEGRG